MKVPQGLTRAEQETYLRCNAEDNEWDFYSRDPKFKRLLERRGYEVREDHQGFWAAKLPLDALTIRSAKRKPRELSDEQRRKIAERFARLREKNKAAGSDG
jgi:hypothetical protein